MWLNIVCVNMVKFLLMFGTTNFQASESAVPHSTSHHSNVSSVADVTESWEFRSALEAPIAKLESLDEIDRQVHNGVKTVLKLD